MHTTGFPSPASDFEENTLDLNSLVVKNPSATFFMIAEGETILENIIYPGDILVIDRSVKPSSDNIVISCEDGKFILRSFRYNKNDFSRDKYKNIIWGVVTWIIHRSGTKKNNAR